MLDNQYLFASVLLVAAGSRSSLPPAEPPADTVADMKGAVDIAKPYRGQRRRDHLLQIGATANSPQSGLTGISGRPRDLRSK
jgi:hypothetical protein